MSSSMHQTVELPPAGIVSSMRANVAPPPMYQVVILNDDYTPGDFVVEVLIQIFHKPVKEAVDIMFNVHNNGRGVAGVYTREIAEARCAQVRGTARNHNHPLQCIMEVV